MKNKYMDIHRALKKKKVNWSLFSAVPGKCVATGSLEKKAPIGSFANFHSVNNPTMASPILLKV